VLLPFVAGVFAFRRHSDRGMRALFFYFCFATVVETWSRHLSEYHQNNIWLYNGLIVVECLLFVNVLACWHGGKTVRGAAMGLSVGYVVFWFIEVFVDSDPSEINNVVFAVAALLNVGFSGLALYAMSGNPEPTLFRNPRFWMATAMLTFFSMAVGIFSLLDVVVQRGGDTVMVVWSIYSFFNIFANILYAIGFLCSLHRLK
jgi:hypothetical protein